MTPPEACPHRPPCPGCPRYGETGPPPEAWRRLAALAAEAGLEEPSFETTGGFGQRHRARLMVRGRARSPKVGLFQAGSHRIVDIPRCGVHHPAINAAAAALRRAIRATDLPPYADRPHTGLVRSLQAVVERPGGRLQIVVTTRDASAGAALPLLESLRSDLGERLHSLFWNGNPERTNVILGPHWERIEGPACLREEIGGVGVHFPPGAFGQSHLGLADRISAWVARSVPDGARALEFHAGCGALGLGCLSRVAALAMNELAPAGLEGLAAGLAERPEPERRRAEILPGRAAEHAGRVRGAEVVLVDPPRRGLEPELLEALVSDPPERLLYVSCGLDAFEREARALLAAGRLRLAELRVFDLFPFTEHVETAARFDRS